MKKYSGIVVLLILSLLLVFISGCTDNNKTSTSKKKGEDAQASQQLEEKTDSKDEKDDSKASDDFEGQPLVESDKIPEEESTAMGNLAGKWLLQTPTENGTTNVIKVKFDNVGGFTLATGTTESETAHVGSYTVEGNKITMSATTSGPSTGEDTYELRMDPAVFEYTYEINADRTQLVLTPTNDNAKQITGDAPITLTKS